jgi:hypothetical protein
MREASGGVPALTAGATPAAGEALGGLPAPAAGATPAAGAASCGLPAPAASDGVQRTAAGKGKDPCPMALV